MILVCPSSAYSMIQALALPGSRGLEAPQGTGCLGRAQSSNRGKRLIVGKLQLKVEGTEWRVRWLEELREPLEQQEQPGLGAKESLVEDPQKQLGKGLQSLSSVGTSVFSLWKPY